MLSAEQVAEIKQKRFSQYKYYKTLKLEKMLEKKEKSIEKMSKKGVLKSTARAVAGIAAGLGTTLVLYAFGDETMRQSIPTIVLESVVGVGMGIVTTIGAKELENDNIQEKQLEADCIFKVLGERYQKFNETNDFYETDENLTEEQYDRRKDYYADFMGNLEQGLQGRYFVSEIVDEPENLDDLDSSLDDTRDFDCF